MSARTAALFAVVLFASNAALGCSNETSSPEGSSSSSACPASGSEQNAPAPAPAAGGSDMETASTTPCTTSAATESGSSDQGSTPPPSTTPAPKKEAPANQCRKSDQGCVSDFDCCSNSCDTFGSKTCR